MNYLALLSLIQKNHFRLLNYHRLRESLQGAEPSMEALVYYLRHHEPGFHQEFCLAQGPLQAEVQDLLSLKLQGIEHSFLGDVLYPPSFLRMADAPLMFSFRGHPCWLFGRSLAVVGSRDASMLSTAWMQEHFVEFLRQEKAVVISGGARGIDQLAHQLALRQGCSTAVVLPSGLGRVYPRSLEAFEKRVLDAGGCFLSEYPFQQKMLKHFFLDRNRLIAGLGLATLLVEAKRRSGSLITAHRASEIGRPVLVVPGHPLETSYLGSLDLLFEGANMIRDAEDLCMYFRSELKNSPESFTIPSEGDLLKN